MGTVVPFARPRKDSEKINLPPAAIEVSEETYGYFYRMLNEARDYLENRGRTPTQQRLDACRPSIARCPTGRLVALFMKTIDDDRLEDVAYWTALVEELIRRFRPEAT